MKGGLLKDKSLKYGAALPYKKATQTLFPYSNTPMTGSNIQRRNKACRNM